MSDRKRKPTSPSFRLPNPRDPVAGSFGPLTLDCLLCRFELTAVLTTALDRTTAVIREQWGYGPRHSYNDVIKVLNYAVIEEDAEADPPVTAVYRFHGGIGEMGLAYWDTSQRWVILDLGPPGGLVGGCLAENHPGRGVVFDICLGAWDSTADKWTYDCDVDPVKAIDWRFGVPYPDAGSQGLFEARASDTYGTVYECVALDCTSPGTCDD